MDDVNPEKKKGKWKPPEDSIDPSTIDKKTLHEKADAKNVVGLTTIGRKPYLTCGAKAKNKAGLCCMTAGQGTDHVGYGRCKYHGGCSTGPKTAEGKAASGGNNTLHGFYMAALSKEEQEIYGQLVEKRNVGLENEIFILKSKILNYLRKWRDKWDAFEAKEGPDQADRNTRVFYKEGEGPGAVRSFYQAGTIEDRALDRALNTLGRLVEKHARLTEESGDDLVSQINAELKAASFGQVSLSWGGKPQSKQEGGGANVGPESNG